MPRLASLRRIVSSAQTFTSCVEMQPHEHPGGSRIAPKNRPVNVFVLAMYGGKIFDRVAERQLDASPRNSSLTQPANNIGIVPIFCSLSYLQVKVVICFTG